MKTLIFSFLVMSPLLFADADFCEEDVPCDGKDEKVIIIKKPTPHKIQVEDMDVPDNMDNATTWPGKAEDSFMDALTR